jgi:hypothetical protein
MGNKDIANFLLSKGARMNIFCAAMLGRLDVVKAILSAFPELKTSKGPHGLQLLHHATKGLPRPRSHDRRLYDDGRDRVGGVAQRDDAAERFAGGDKADDDL